MREGPVLLRHLDEVDPRVLAAQAQGGEVVGNAAEEGALLRQRPPRADDDLHDHDVVRARDAEVARVVDQVAGLVLAQDLEAVELRHIDRLDQRAVDRVAELAAELRRPALAQRNSHQGHGASCRGGPQASARRAASAAALSAARTAGRAGARLPRCAGDALHARFPAAALDAPGWVHSSAFSLRSLPADGTAGGPPREGHRAMARAPTREG